MPATLVAGFLEAGKTTWIQDCILHDYFHKRGTTLILALEDGETEYDTAALKAYRTEVAVAESGEDITAFCREALDRVRPDRVYVELNAMRPELRTLLPDCLKVVFTAALIDFTTLPLYYQNMRQQLQAVVAGADQVIFNRCPDKALLAEYGNAFRLMNNRASWLWEGPTGYHEKAFGILVPYDLTRPELTLDTTDFVAFMLDGRAAPEHYAGKTVRFLCQADALPEPGRFLAGRLVMTCCMADLQFMGFPCEYDGPEQPRPGSWHELTAEVALRPDAWGRPQLILLARSLTHAMPPEKLICGA